MQTRGMEEDRPGATSWANEMPAPSTQSINGSAIWNETWRSCLGVERKEANVVTSKTTNPNTMMIIPGPGCLNTLQINATSNPELDEPGQACQT
jgi:hypothetical protein